MPDFTLTLPRRVLISGAAGGIGGAISRALAVAGAELIGTDRGEAPKNWPGQWVTADAASKEGLSTIVENAVGPFDGVVFAAGVLDGASWENIELEAAMRLLSINLVAPFFLLRGILPHLTDSASVAVIGSIAGLRGSPATPFYAASKAGLRNLAASLALLLQPRGIRVNVIAPGLIDTPLTDSLNVDLATRRNLTVSEIAAERAAAIPMGRAGTSDEVAETCLFLLSRQASYITGSTVFLTGGVLAGAT